MVDNGASHCFINEKAINRLGLQISSIRKFRVRLGDGSRSISMGVCRVVVIEMGPMRIQVDCYVFRLGTVDIILGVTWLKTLGEVSSN